VTTEEEVEEYCGAFTQFYREDAHYLERTANWIERVGMKRIKQHVVDNKVGRKALNERFKVSQRVAQVDPWKERADGIESHEFTPLKIAG
jgi:nitrite reductase (NADH) large subunit